MMHAEEQTVRRELRDPLLRQAAWAVGSAPLLRSAPGLHFDDGAYFARWAERLAPAFLAWDQDAEALASLRADWESAPPLLGKRFEALVGWVLARDPAWEVVQSGQVWTDAGRTLGEWDLLLRDREADRWVHVELACKFYLQVGGARGNRWLGVNPDDTLEARLASLRRQMGLGRVGAVAGELARAGWRVDAERVWMKGWWFYPVAGMGHARPAAGADPDAPSGWWCTVSQAVNWARGNPSHWLPLPRLDWLRGGLEEGPTSGRYPGAPLTGSQWAAWLAQPLPGPGQLVVQVVETSAGWVEASRGMVVPEDWPTRKAVQSGTK
jgi:hypothetical protein